MGGWAGGEMEIKAISASDSVEVEVEAELGNIGLQMENQNIPHVQCIKWFHFFTTHFSFS